MTALEKLDVKRDELNEIILAILERTQDINMTSESARIHITKEIIDSIEIFLEDVKEL